MIDAHHHLWNLTAVDYPWLMAKGEPRFFGDPAPIQRDYLIDEFAAEASAEGFCGSVHIQVGARDGMAEAVWVQRVADEKADWPMLVGSAILGGIFKEEVIGSLFYNILGSIGFAAVGAHTEFVRYDGNPLLRVTFK